MNPYLNVHLKDHTDYEGSENNPEIVLTKKALMLTREDFDTVMDQINMAFMVAVN
jgi:hypothetical protein